MPAGEWTAGCWRVCPHTTSASKRRVEERAVPTTSAAGVCGREKTGLVRRYTPVLSTRHMSKPQSAGPVPGIVPCLLPERQRSRLAEAGYIRELE